jgi:DNA-binding NarL/FixJ family response regulator
MARSQRTESESPTRRRRKRARVLVIERGSAVHLILGQWADSFIVDLRRSASGVLDDRPSSGADVMVVDLDACGRDRPGVVAALCTRAGRAPLLAVSSESKDSDVVAVLKAGASGYLFKDDLDERLVAAIYETLAGGVPLSHRVARLVLQRARRKSGQIAAVSVDQVGALPKRKREILELFSRGLSYDQIALTLGISVNTVRTHVRDIYEQLGASTKVEAVLAAMRLGLLPNQRD